MFVRKNLKYMILVLAVALLSSLGTMAFIDAEKAKDIAEIEKVIANAPRIIYNTGMLPKAYRDNPNLKVPPDVVESAKKRVKEELSKYYDVNSEVYKLRLRQYTESVDGEAKTKFRNLGAGVKKVEKVDIVVDGDYAKAEKITIEWAKFREECGTVYTPENKIKYTFELKKIDGRWKITFEDFYFPEGI